MLKPGTIDALYHNNRDSPLFRTPIVQVLSLKKIESESNKILRFHITISDGKLYMKGIFSSQMSKNMKDLKSNAIIKIYEFVILEKNGNCFIYVKSCEKIKDSERIGMPKSIGSLEKTDSSIELDSSKIKSIDNNDCIKRTVSNELNKRPHTNTNVGAEGKNVTYNSRPQNAEESTKNYTPIKALNPFQTKWVVKGTVHKKSDVREFRNKDGKLFNFELVDKTGSIKCVAFNDEVDLFFNLITDGSVVEISKATVRMANKKFSNTTNDYEIHLEKNSLVNLVDEEGISLPLMLSKISDIAGNSNKKNCDVIGVVHEAFPSTIITTKVGQKEVKKRDLTLVDDTGSIRVTLWGEKADLEIDNHPVIVLKDARIGEFNNVTVLNTSFGSAIKIDPEMEEAYSLRGWYDKNKSSIVVERRQKTEYSFLEEIEDYGTCVAVVLFIREDNLFYNACINDCNKKVSITDEGYRCERCNQTNETCNIRYLTTLHFADFTQQIWLNVFDDFCTKFFKVPAVELKKMGEENAQQLQNYLKALLFNEHVIRVRRTEESYNGEMRVRWRGMSISKVNYLDEAKRIVSLLGL